MVQIHFVIALLLIALAIGNSATVYGQNYPNKPIRIVAGEVGGGSDFTSRLIAPGLSVALGQRLVIDNRGSGVIPGEIVSRAAPDGYTLIVAAGNFWIGPLMQKTPYDPIKDFSPITMLNTQPNVLVVHPSVPVKSVKELIALAKLKPGELNCAAGATGGSSHLAAELFKVMAGVDIVSVPYKGGGPALIDMLGGHVQLMFPPAGVVARYTSSGELRALAVTSAKPSALAPGLPTVAATGLPGYEWGATFGIFAPAKTSPAVINRLNREIVRLLNQPDVKQKFFDFGVETVGNKPAEFGAQIELNIRQLGDVIKQARIHLE